MTDKEPNRFHDNLIYGFGCLDSSRPLDYFNPLTSPRVYGRPTNLRQIISWWGRIKAAWLVLTLDAVAVRWYDEQNAHKHGRCWYEWVQERDRLEQIKRKWVSRVTSPCEGTGVQSQPTH